MLDQLCEIAKEITIQMLPRTKLSGASTNEEIGKAAGTIFRAVLKEVVAGADEVVSKVPTKRTTEK